MSVLIFKKDSDFFKCSFIVRTTYKPLLKYILTQVLILQGKFPKLLCFLRVRQTAARERLNASRERIF